MTNREIIEELNKHYLDTLSYYELIAQFILFNMIIGFIINLIEKWRN